MHIYGLRRVGKTRLVLECLRQQDLYFFVNKDKTSGSLLKEYEAQLKSKNILAELESIDNWDVFFKVLFERFEGTVAFDEFQNFLQVDKAVMGILQKYMDMNENKKRFLMIFSGSTVGLLKKTLRDKKSPLYGRIKRQMHLKPMSFPNILEMCRELEFSSVSRAIELYAIFGGFPKYYTSIEDEALKGKSMEEILERFFFMENAVLEEEVMEILSLEFGKRSGIYYDIIAAIADGCTRISEIASYLRKKETALTRQLNELIYKFDIVSSEKQAIGNKKALFINHPLASFWFSLFHKNLSAYKRRETSFVTNAKNSINGFIGRRFEHVCGETLRYLNANNALPFSCETIGRQWGRMQDKPKGENQYEIDTVALSQKSKSILFAGCRWKERNITLFSPGRSGKR